MARLVVLTNSVAHKPRHAQFWRQLDFKVCGKCHGKRAVIIFGENTQETLLKDRGGEGIGKHHDTACVVAQGFHFIKTNLIIASGKNVNHNAVTRRTAR